MSDTPEQLLLGDILKKMGQQLVLENEHEEWKSLVGQVLDKLIESKKAFDADNLRRMAATCGIDEPHHPNCWGALIGAASKAKRITMIGINRNTIPSAHARLIGKWIGT